MTKSRKLLILVIILAALGIIYGVASRLPGNNKVSDTELKKVKLSVVDSKKITKMTLNSKDSSLTFEKSGDSWVVKPDPGVKLDQAPINEIVTNFASIYGDRVISDNPENLEEYGLKPVTVTAIASLDDGSVIEMYLGSKAPTGDAYYMMYKGDPKLYTIALDVAQSFYYSLSDVRDKAIQSLNKDNINYIKIVNDKGRAMEFKKTEEGTPEALEYGADSWMITQPYSKPYPTDYDAVMGIRDAITNVGIDKFVETSPSDYSKYGLDKPLIDITAKDGASQLQKFHMYIGKDNGSGLTYFMLEGSKEVYGVSTAKLEGMNLKTMDMVYKYAFMPLIDDVDQITIEKNGTKDVLSMSSTTTPAQNPDEQAQVVTTFKLNGKDVTDENARPFYQNLIGLVAEAENDKGVQGKAEVTMTFIMNKGTEKQVTISYHPYNSDFYSIVRDGKSDFLISRSQFDKIFDNLEKLKNS